MVIEKEKMGVVAFPNPDKRVIRFIDSSYHELFKMADGESITLTRFDGSRVLVPCTYIDDYHTKIGRGVYQICEFAELMEQSGAVYTPERPHENDNYGIYEIYQIKDVGCVDYCFREYDEAKKQLYATDYQRAYAGVFARPVAMEMLYTKHNRDSRPFGQRMRSMSVSDVLVIKEGGKKNAYYVDSFGFQEVPEFLKQLERKKERGEKLK